MMDTKMKFAALGGLLLLSGQAQAASVGGVVWDPANLDDFSATDTMYETVAGFTGAISLGTSGGVDLYQFTGTNTLSGYGRITSMNGESEATFCPGCELTHQFGGYKLYQWLDVDGSGAVDSGDHVSFTGGSMQMYVDNSPDFSSISLASAGDEGGANALWLDLDAVDKTAMFGGASIDGTLFSTIDTGTLGTGTEGGEGFGNFEVVGGLAMDNFDTNTKDGDDFSFTSSFQPRACAPGCPEGMQLFGSNDLACDSIPEPGTMALMGLGMLGFGAIRRRRSHAA